VSLDVDADTLPRDWRKVVKIGAFVVLLSGGVGAVAAPISLQFVRPVEHKLDTHLAEVAAMRPSMERTVQDLEDKLDSMDRKVDALLEDCYRRGGCRR
jgi:hypothetical protein